MVNFTDLFTGNYGSFMDWWMSFHQYFHGLSLEYQILMIIGLVVLTVGGIVLSYYIIKGALYLVYYILKGVYLLLKAIFWDIPKAIFGKAPQKTPKPTVHEYQPPVSVQGSTYRRPNYQSAPVTTQVPVETMRPQTSVPVERPAPKHAPNPTQTNEKEFKFPEINSMLHCPNCGKGFTPEMNTIMLKNGKVFCEYCGNQLEYRLA